MRRREYRASVAKTAEDLRQSRIDEVRDLRAERDALKADLETERALSDRLAEALVAERQERFAGVKSHRVTPGEARVSLALAAHRSLREPKP